MILIFLSVRHVRKVLYVFIHICIKFGPNIMIIFTLAQKMVKIFQRVSIAKIAIYVGDIFILRRF